MLMGFRGFSEFHHEKNEKRVEKDKAIKVELDRMCFERTEIEKEIGN
jgi:hypothetical protein